MGVNYGVTPAEVTQIASNLSTIYGEYMSEVKKIYESYDFLNSNWKGLGATTHYQDANNLRPSIEELGKIIGQYSNFSGTSAKIYDETDKGIAEASRKNYSINS